LIQPFQLKVTLDHEGFLLCPLMNTHKSLFSHTLCNNSCIVPDSSNLEGSNYIVRASGTEAFDHIFMLLQEDAGRGVEYEMSHIH